MYKPINNYPPYSEWETKYEMSIQFIREVLEELDTIIDVRDHAEETLHIKIPKFSINTKSYGWLVLEYKTFFSGFSVDILNKNEELARSIKRDTIRKIMQNSSIWIMDQNETSD